MAFTCLFLSAAVAHAQDATVVGTVTDESKSVLPGATITATDVATGRQFTAVTLDRGEYRLAGLPPSTYKIQAELAGFSSVVLADLEMLVGQNATIPFTLKVASIAESVTVIGESPLVDTRRA